MCQAVNLFYDTAIVNVNMNVKLEQDRRINLPCGFISLPFFEITSAHIPRIQASI